MSEQSRNLKMGKNAAEQAQDGAVTRQNRANLANALRALLDSNPTKETLIAKLTALEMIRSGEGGNEGEMAGKTQEELIALVKETLADLNEGAAAQVVDYSEAIKGRVEATTTPATPETAEKPEALTKMIADMKRTANRKNKFYNFGSKNAMLTALNSLPGATMQTIEDFANKLSYRRTEKSFPVLVNSADGASYLLTESAPSAKNVDINAAQAKELVNSWGFSSPNNAKWEFLRSLGLVDLQDVSFEWLPSETASTDAGFAWYGSARYDIAYQFDATFSGERGGVRALQVLAKAA